jgi:hypothetical protein
MPIPGDRVAQSLVERHFRPPTERAQLCRVERIPAIVPGTVCNRPDERLRFADQLQNAPGEIDIGEVVAAADVVDLAGRSCVEQQSRCCSPSPYSGSGRSAIAFVMNSGITFSGK